MKKQLKKPFLMMAVTALVLVGTLKVGGAMAYFTTYSTASGSVQMNMGFTQTIPHEEVDSRGKHVSVENTGDYDCFVRVKAFAPVALTYLAPDGGWRIQDGQTAAMVSGITTRSFRQVRQRQRS